MRLRLIVQGDAVKEIIDNVLKGGHRRVNINSLSPFDGPSPDSSSTLSPLVAIKVSTICDDFSAKLPLSTGTLQVAVSDTFYVLGKIGGIPSFNKRQEEDLEQESGAGPSRPFPSPPQRVVILIILSVSARRHNVITITVLRLLRKR